MNVLRVLYVSCNRVIAMIFVFNAYRILISVFKTVIFGYVFLMNHIAACH